MRLLLVDNEKSFVQALKEILVSNRYTVECAYDGEEALAFLENEKFDCLLLDIMMPHVDGYTVLETIRKKGDKTLSSSSQQKAMSTTRSKALI